MGEGAFGKWPTILLDVRGEDPVSALTYSGAKPGGSVHSGARFGKGAGLAGSNALATPAPIDPTAEAEGMAGI